MRKIALKDFNGRLVFPNIFFCPKKCLETSFFAPNLVFGNIFFAKILDVFKYIYYFCRQINK